MAFLDNNPTFTYVRVSNLSILYNDRTYQIENIYTNCKYLYWDTTHPNMLIETNIRKTQSATMWLICINENGIHTEVNHDELTYVFSGYAQSSTGGVNSNEFLALKQQVDENTESYLSISQTVNGINTIVGDEETLEDGSIIKNLNTLKLSSDGMNLKIQEIETKFSDKYDGLRDNMSDALIDLLTSVSTLKITFEKYSEKQTLEIEDVDVINDHVELVRLSLTAMSDIKNRVCEVLEMEGQGEYREALETSYVNLETDVNSMLEYFDMAISDNAITAVDITTVLLGVGEATQSLAEMKALCDEIMVLGLGGTLYDSYTQIQVDNDIIKTTIGDVQTTVKGSIKTTIAEYYLSSSQTALIGGEWSETAPTHVTGYFVWQRLKYTYNNGDVVYSSEVCISGKDGKDGTSITILGSYDTYDELVQAHPSNNEEGDCYVVDGDLYVWINGIFESVGQIQGASSYVHIKYSNDGGATFTSNNGEEAGLYMGTYTDFIETDSTNVSDYKWALIRGENGLNGADGINGQDGTSIIWQGTYENHPTDAQNGWAYYNSTQGKSFVYQNDTWYQMSIDGTDGKDGKNGTDGISIIWKGELATAPSNPVENWVYKDTDNGTIYIYNGSSWETMVLDGLDGIDGAKGEDGYSVYITYHDSIDKPLTPIGDGTTDGWHTDATETVIWLSQKVAESADKGEWGDPIKIKGESGKDGTSINILGTYDTYEDLIVAHPSGNTNGDSYVIGTDLYVWVDNEFKNVGQFKGDKGDNTYFHVKYSNDGGETFTSNNGEDVGLYMGTYSDFIEVDSTDVKKYKWALIKGQDGVNGADGVDGIDGTSIIWKGTYTSHPSNAQNGWAYYNSSQKKSFVYQTGTWYQMSLDGLDGADGKNGENGIGIVWKGESAYAPNNPQTNWAYKDTDNGIVYIYNGSAWESMVLDGTDGADGTNGEDGLSVFITYHDSIEKPSNPIGDGTTDGWHTNPTETVVWLSQKVAESATSGIWGNPIRIKGKDGKDGTSITIKGKYDTYDELIQAHPSDNTNGDGYVVGKDLYVWDGSKFLNVGQIQGANAYLHIKYSNDEGKTFTANNGEVIGEYIGTYTDDIEEDSMNVSDYKWSKFKGDKGQSLVKSTPQWYLSTSKTSQSGGSWSTVMPEYKQGYYMWLRYEMVWENPTATTYSTPTLEQIAQNVNTVSEKQSELEQTIDGFKLTVSETYTTKTDLSNAEQELQGQIDETNNNLATNYSTTVQMNSAIEQKANSITSTVSETYTTREEYSNGVSSLSDSIDGVQEQVNATNDNLANNYSTTTQMKAEIEQKTNAITSTVSELYTTKEEFNDLSTDVQGQIDESKSKMSQVEQTADKINWLVKSGTSSSNMTLTDRVYSLVTSSISLTADNIDLNGYISANGNFSIDTRGNMTALNATITGSIQGASISGGTVHGTVVTGGSIDGTYITGTSISGGTISGSSISGGTISGTTISGGTIKGGTISGGSISGSSITIGSNFKVTTSGVLTAKQGTFEDGYVKACGIMGSEDSSCSYGYAFRIYTDGRLYSANTIQCYGDMAYDGVYCQLTYDGRVTATNYMQTPGIKTSNSEFIIATNDASVNYTSSHAGRLRLRYSGGYYYFDSHYDGNTRLGSTSYYWNVVYAVNGCKTSSDRTLKENIKYLDYNEVNGYSVKEEILTLDDMYDFINNDYLMATYNYINDEKKNTKVSAIAQDIIYNLDGSDNVVGQMIVDCEEAVSGDGEEQGSLSMNQTQLLNVTIGALQKACQRIDELENRIKELEGE